MRKKEIKLGSLFDGIGGFPLAGIRNGIKPIWASEIEAFPISVTRHHFPDMAHVGDITKLNGAELTPVDIITGGSPCQDVSCAGRRSGLAGERSGLFFEQIRIVKEMRDADERRQRAAHAVRPRYMVWENVPGAFSSGNPHAEDFRVVLEEIARIVDGDLSIPRPPAGMWKSAGAVLGGRFSIAWRILDTQYWPGTPQRRKRIFLVADFGGHTAPKILFEQDRLFGDIAEVESPRQGVTGTTQTSVGNTGGPDGCLTPWDAQSRRIFDDSGVWPALYGGDGGGHGYVKTDYLTPWDTQRGRVFTENGVSPTLAGSDGAGGRNPAGLLLTAGFCDKAAPTAGGIGYQEECAPTLRASESVVPSVLCLNDQGGSQMQCSEDVAGTLRAQERGHQPLVMATQHGGAEIGACVCTTITSATETSGNNQSELFENHGVDSRYTGPHKVAPTISASAGTGGNNLPLITTPQAFSLDSVESNSMKSKNPHSGCRKTDIARTIDTGNPDPSKNQGGIAILQETYCIAGNIIDRQVHNGGNGLGVQPDISYTITSTDKHAVYARQRSDEFMPNDVTATQSARQYKDATDLAMDTAGLDCRSGTENGDLCGTLQAHPTGGYSLNSTHPVRTGNLIRRLTPLECERLMGYEDGWTDIGGGSDSARYKALGNSVAIPCVTFVLRGIAYFLRQYNKGTGN